MSTQTEADSEQESVREVEREGRKVFVERKLWYVDDVLRVTFLCLCGCPSHKKTPFSIDLLFAVTCVSTCAAGYTTPNIESKCSSYLYCQGEPFFSVLGILCIGDREEKSHIVSMNTEILALPDQLTDQIENSKKRKA